MSGFKSGKGRQVYLNAVRIGFCLLSPSHSTHRVHNVDQSTEAGLTAQLSNSMAETTQNNTFVVFVFWRCELTSALALELALR